MQQGPRAGKLPTAVPGKATMQSCSALHKKQSLFPPPACRQTAPWPVQKHARQICRRSSQHGGPGAPAKQKQPTMGTVSLVSLSEAVASFCVALTCANACGLWRWPRRMRLAHTLAVVLTGENLTFLAWRPSSAGSCATRSQSPVKATPDRRKVPRGGNYAPWGHNSAGEGKARHPWDGIGRRCFAALTGEASLSAALFSWRRFSASTFVLSCASRWQVRVFDCSQGHPGRPQGAKRG